MQGHLLLIRFDAGVTYRLASEESCEMASRRLFHMEAQVIEIKRDALAD